MPADAADACGAAAATNAAGGGLDALLNAEVEV
jgi:hypothetical protein